MERLRYVFQPYLTRTRSGNESGTRDDLQVSYLCFIGMMATACSLVNVLESQIRNDVRCIGESELVGCRLEGRVDVFVPSRFKARSHYWRKAPSKNLISGQNDSCNPVSQGTQDKQLVEGIIDTGVFEKLKTSIIGTTKVVMEPEKLIELLENKGLREFEVRKLAGNQFLIDFDREELFDQCLNWEWVWLPEIFSDIIRWFKGYSPGNRLTWVAIYGVPLFAWNNYTFNNILNRWGVIFFGR
ncbi:hypothetical protein V6N11_062429 [Hibiscus sabdariffa]|uniref:DUF4283 domain-containing protein n=1 Tax=Hibiscus sabdariffa TaxID=183260 RepID=A0ABR2PT27_9ROSI